MRWNGFWILTLAVLLAASVIPARANLITDPGFESCTGYGAAIPDWTSANVSCSYAHTGTFGAGFTGSATLSQTITTTIGDNYDFSFWLAVYSPSSFPLPPASFTVSFGSDEVTDFLVPVFSITQATT